MTSQQRRAKPELCFYGKQLQLALPPKQNVCRLKHIKGPTEHYLLGQNTTCELSGQSPLSSYKTALKQQLNSEK